MATTALPMTPLLFDAHVLFAAKQGCSRHKFLKAEDDQLRILVTKYGEQNWNLISSHMNRRNARQCRERYKNYLSPNYRNTPWTPDEEALLEAKVKELGPKWSAIARCFEARSDVNVKNHWAAMQIRNERVMKSAQAKVAQENGDSEVDGIWRIQNLVPLEEDDDPAYFFA
jgi:hypothetical protein